MGSSGVMVSAEGVAFWRKRMKFSSTIFARFSDMNILDLEIILQFERFSISIQPVMARFCLGIFGKNKVSLLGGFFGEF